MTTDFAADALTFSLEKTRANLATLKDFPNMTKDGAWVCVADGGWTGGHWVGLLWLTSLYSGDPSIRDAARQWTARLAPRQHDNGTHDLGFLFELSHILGTKIGERDLKAPALQAAQTLITRFNPRGGYIQAWGPLDGTPQQRGRAIIDTMMNLDLLFWASKESGDSRYADIAVTCARTALQHHVRADGSTAHVTDYDADTGAFIKQDTAQGLSATSYWSRGHSWACYGFAECYRETGDETFLIAARTLIDYCLSRLPADRVPYWDYDSPLIPDDVRDSSAASILADAMLILAPHDPANAERYRAEASAILESLWNNYTSPDTAEPSILLQAARCKPEGDFNQGLIYGDFYFVEALLRIMKPGALPNTLILGGLLKSALS